MDATPDTGAPPAGNLGGDTGAVEPAWHEGLIAKGADGAESLADPATWLDKAPKPLGDFIRQNMTAARAKTDGMLKVPGEADPPEAWDSVWKAIGRPDAPDGYGIKAPEKMPDGVAWDDAFAGEFAKTAHAIGMPKAHAEKLLAWHTEQMGAQVAKTREWAAGQIAEEQKALKEAYGGQLADVAAAAQKAAIEHGLDAKFFDPTAAEFLGVGAFKVVAGLAGKLAAATKEGSFGGAGGGSVSTGGYEYANAVTTNKDHPDYAKYWAGDKDVIQRVNDGWKQMPKAAA